ncbi:MAG: TonB-dependent receptor [Muribaculaceae bacterium]|nr:TonB-dependent receptor [Muribaculaceae bacterium]
MRLKLFLLVLLTAFLPSLAQTSNVVGVVLNGSTGSPVSGAYVSLRGADKTVQSTFSGNFALSAEAGGSDYLVITCDGFEAAGLDINLTPGTVNVGEIRLVTADYATDFYGDDDDIIYDEAMLEDEEGNSQGIAALTGANDNIYYNTASYNFGPMYFRFRGLQNEYQKIYINGVDMNDPIRGNFNFNSLLGMTSRAFRNKTTTVGMDVANYGFGGLAGSTSYNTITDTYAPGFNGSLAYTNSNYYLRGMVTYATGLNSKGWAVTLSAIGRYSNEGVVEGTFYHSGGFFLSVEKLLNAQNSLTLTAWGGPTQRANSSATYQEAYDLVGSNLYNPNWGWFEGKKRAARIVESFDPTAMLTWLYKGDKTTLNTTASVRWVNYCQSALQYYKANDPNPTYYRYLPSYYKDDAEQYDLYYGLWTSKNPNVTQINWDNLYMVNALNNIQNQDLPDAQKKGASYILENRHSNQFNAMFNSYINHRITNTMSLQAGVSFNYTKASFYKTIRDLLGGQFWVDIDPFSDRDITIAPDNLQNDLDHPNRRVYKGDKFGYNYDFYFLRGNAWLQNTITSRHWDVNYGVQMTYTQYNREGHMRNGRAPQNSLGKSTTLRFDDVSAKVGATYKVDGRNFFIAHAEYGTRAPLADQVFIAPRVKNTIVNDVESERDLSVDLTYQWNYRRFRGALTAYYIDVNNAIERTGFYDDRYSTYAIYVLQGVRRVNKGLELGMSYKITPSITATFAGTWAKYQYKNNPNGTRSFENGLYADTTQTVYLKNFYVGSTPQTVFNVGIDYAAPKNWFFNVNATWQGDAYVNLSPAYHEELPDLWKKVDTIDELQAWIEDLSTQDKLKNAWSLNLSIGKVLYLSRSVSMNINLNVNNILNNRNVVTYAYQQGRLDTTNYERGTYPNRYSYAQGARVFLNIGIRF